MAQTDSSEFILDLEFRPRFELRNGYGELPEDSDSPAAFVSNRTRLSINYNRPKFKFHTSIQDIRTWGQFGQFSSANGLGIFEAYVETQIGKNAWLKLGRQAVELDNGRLFSAANWNQASRAHEGINFIWKKKTWNSELMAFYNQSGEPLFGQTQLSNNYLALGLHYFTWKINSDWTLIVQNSLDAHQSDSVTVVYARGTSGGRLTYQTKHFRTTAAAHYQYGQIATGQKVSAYFLHPEVGVFYKRWSARLGAELISGNGSEVNAESTGSFQTLYGVAFKFNGNLNQFTRYPEDVNNLGLFNPYLFTRFKLSKTVGLKWEHHMFYTHRKPESPFYQNTSNYLGYEMDLKVKLRINDFTTIESGVAAMLVSETLEELRGQTINSLPSWAFVMVKFNPRLLRIKQPIEKKSARKLK